MNQNVAVMTNVSSDTIESPRIVIIHKMVSENICYRMKLNVDGAICSLEFLKLSQVLM